MTKAFTPVDLPADAETKVVLIEGTNGWDKQVTTLGDGWRVVGFLELETQVMKDYQDERGYWSTRTAKELRTHALLARTQNAAEAYERRRQEIREALEQGLVSNHKNQVRQLEKELEEQATSFNKATSEIERWRASHDKLGVQLEDLRQQKYKLEKDLARVREAIGTVRWKEIIG